MKPRNGWTRRIWKHKERLKELREIGLRWPRIRLNRQLDWNVDALTYRVMRNEVLRNKWAKNGRLKVRGAAA